MLGGYTELRHEIGGHWRTRQIPGQGARKAASGNIFDDPCQCRESLTISRGKLVGNSSFWIVYIPALIFGLRRPNDKAYPMVTRFLSRSILAPAP
jgi:hypothetical protein